MTGRVYSMHVAGGGGGGIPLPEILNSPPPEIWHARANFQSD